MIGSARVARAWARGKRSAASRGSAGWKTRPVWAASWWAMSTTVGSASRSPASATTFHVERWGRKRRRNHSSPRPRRPTRRRRRRRPRAPRRRGARRARPAGRRGVGHPAATSTCRGRAPARPGPRTQLAQPGGDPLRGRALSVGGGGALQGGELADHPLDRASRIGGGKLVLALLGLPDPDPLGGRRDGCRTGSGRAADGSGSEMFGSPGRRCSASGRAGSRVTSSEKPSALASTSRESAFDASPGRSDRPPPPGRSRAAWTRGCDAVPQARPAPNRSVRPEPRTCPPARPAQPGQPPQAGRWWLWCRARGPTTWSTWSRGKSSIRLSYSTTRLERPSPIT